MGPAAAAMAMMEDFMMREREIELFDRGEKM